MRVLLDTHIFIWLADEPDRLSLASRALCAAADTTLLVSIASLWEMAIKAQSGRLALGKGLAELVESQVRVNGVVVLPVELSHVLQLQRLPSVHKDPFDRMLIAQSLAEHAPIVTNDARILMYGVPTVRADR